jgi:hypothetical protein
MKGGAKGMPARRTATLLGVYVRANRNRQPRKLFQMQRAQRRWLRKPLNLRGNANMEGKLSTASKHGIHEAIGPGSLASASSSLL